MAKETIKIDGKRLDKQKKSLIKIINGKELTAMDLNNIDAILNMCDAISDTLSRGNAPELINV